MPRPSLGNPVKTSKKDDDQFFASDALMIEVQTGSGLDGQTGNAIRLNSEPNCHAADLCPNSLRFFIVT